MGFRAVNHIVLPTDGLLNTNLAPLTLFHQAVAGHVVLELAGEDDVAEFVAFAVVVLFRVDDAGLVLGDFTAGLVLLGGIGDLEEIEAGHFLLL